MMNNENEGQTISDIVDILKRKEEDMRTRRNKNMIRLFAESSSDSVERKYELKNANKLNIKMIRQYRYDKNTDKVQLKSIPCICEICLAGNFNECLIYSQQIIEAEVIQSTRSVQLRNPNFDAGDEIDEVDNNENFTASGILRNNTIDIDFVNHDMEKTSQSKPPTPRQDSQNVNNPNSQNVNSPDDIGCVELSSPDPNRVTSSQKEEVIDLKDFGSLDEAEAQGDDEYILNRLNCMSNSDYIEPIRFETDKKSLQRILDNRGELDGWSLNYICHMILKQASNQNDCSFLKTDLSLWFANPVKHRVKWTNNLISRQSKADKQSLKNDEESFKKSKRIIIPWNKDGNHWIVFHLDSTQKIIESFDSLHLRPNPSDVKRITNFLRVSFS